ncbi:hypothetical protein HYPSUDRAFT_205479 [Hypholoma sublateritium FD-334 SS-4]|uniref:Carboxylesterase type B domain-containing protein n=1 Tax=Hypholoma sublateritium (strain FD-334 SS-4) TaxID=945553 RepID=A0A0D2NNL9_HYPSF|nr:hypothetical protein HYPSUDRAFT_205479 [Hypholoma sublateritium FD-334 SS-4]
MLASPWDRPRRAQSPHSSAPSCAVTSLCRRYSSQRPGATKSSPSHEYRCPPRRRNASEANDEDATQPNTRARTASNIPFWAPFPVNCVPQCPPRDSWGICIKRGYQVQELEILVQDQRQASRWIQKYISQFGGDSTKVTTCGESAGAVSASLQMLANGGNTEGLFRGAFVGSGFPIPVGDIINGRKYSDALVEDTGCSGAVDTLQCLRNVPYTTLKAAVHNSPGIFDYQSLYLAWLPRTDSVFLTDNPQKLVAARKVAAILYIFKTYIHKTFLPGITNAQTTQIATLYPSDITQGSPSETGVLNAVTPQFKRFAAFQGDSVFQGPRRWLLQYIASTQNVWVFLSRRLKLLPVLGSVHASDILNIYGGGEMGDHLIRFVNLDLKRAFSRFRAAATHDATAP